MGVLAFLKRRKALRELGILGMNQRNHAYIGRYNPRFRFPLVDNKLSSKTLAIQAGVAVPRLIDVVTTQHDIVRLKPELDRLGDFVIKPAKGSGGKGILVIVGKDGEHYVKASGELLTFNDVERHMSNILGGLYSLGGNSDVAMIEALIRADDVFDDYSCEGVPDIRTIVFKGFPVMAMLRLATRASDGKANLHQGAVGVGLDIATGQWLRAVQFDRPVTHHPDTGHAFAGLTVPHWHCNLELAAACYDMAGLGYLGVDMVLDKDHGPLILELNARPGLAIQIANGVGLLPRLQQIEALGDVKMSVEDRVAYSIQHFGMRKVVAEVAVGQDVAVAP
ncbi:MAG: alpha-L-glutamate ligase-like protein [Oceanospirillales bacterium LUC14_002_19_P2]|nr:MAG: alpha-L-glutamate ligase-like protein [Oceanospirillales bacterium LUC14_002_19_P2]